MTRVFKRIVPNKNGNFSFVALKSGKYFLERIKIEIKQKSNET